MSRIAAHPARLRSLALAMTLIHSAGFAADDDVEEVIVIGQGIGSLRLNTDNGAGSHLGLSALETPASVDLVTRNEILAKGDYSSIDSVTRTAGISTTSNNGNGGMQVSSRGFNGHTTTLNTYDGIRLYIAAGTVNFPADSWTLERIEVLRGAGSVINGMGALATTINYVSRTPRIGEHSLDALAAVGSFGLARGAFSGNVSFNEQLAGRFDVAITKKDGYIDRGEEERRVAATSLLWEPTDHLSIRFSLDYADAEPMRYWGTPIIDGQASDRLRKQNYNYVDAVIDYEDLWARAHTEWRLSDNVTFRNDTFVIEDHRDWQNLEEYYYNGDGTLDRVSHLNIIHDQKQAGTRADVLVTGSFGNLDNRFTIGAEINKTDFDYLNNFNTGGFDYVDTVPVFDAPVVYHPTTTALTQPDYSTDATQYAIFFDDVLQLSDRLSLVIGGRYDDFDFDRVNHAQLSGRDRSEFDAAFDKFTWRAGLVFRIGDSFSAYAQTSTAADPVTSPISINAANADYKLSEGRQYEVGLKQQFADGRSEWTLAYFDIQKEDMVTRIPGTAINGQIGQQSSDGVEVTLRLNPAERLSIDMNAAFVDSVYDEFYAGDVSLSGNTPPDVPDTTANLWVNYSLIDNVQLSAGLRYVGQRYADNENSGVLPSYTVVDASLSWLVNDRTTAILRGRNLTDEKDYVLSQYITDQWVFGEPRAYELSLSYSF